MAKNAKKELVNVAENTTPQNQTNVIADVKQAEQTIKQADSPQTVLTKCLNAGIITQDAHDKLMPIIGEEFMLTTVNKLRADITKREQDILGQAYLDIESDLLSGNVDRAQQTAISHGINTVVISFNHTTDAKTPFNIKRSNTKSGASSPTGERTKTGKWLFTNGNIQHESLRQFVAVYEPDSLNQSLNGTALCNKLKKHINANDWAVINQDSKESTPLAVWSAGKYGVQFS